MLSAVGTITVVRPNDTKLFESLGFVWPFAVLILYLYGRLQYDYSINERSTDAPSKILNIP